MDIERALADYLRANGIETYYSVPKDAPREFVVVERTGGGEPQATVDNPTASLYCYGCTRKAAFELCHRTRLLLALMPQEVENVFSTSIVSEFRSIDAANMMDRYEITATFISQ